MKDIHLLSLLLLAAFLPLGSRAQSKAIFTNPDFSTLSSHEKTLAIVPFSVTLNLRPKDKANMTADELKQQEQQSGLAIQSEMESYLLKKSEHTSYSVAFQDVEETNRLLKAHHIDPDSVSGMDPQQISRILGVDGVVCGKMISSHPLSTGAAVAVDVLVGFGGATNSGTCTIDIYDGPTGKLMWRYEKSLSRGLGSDAGTIIDRIMSKASRKFPYNK
jgi:hypothetical protein